eukprot:tig00020610_g12046.t1
MTGPGSTAASMTRAPGATLQQSAAHPSGFWSSRPAYRNTSNVFSDPLRLPDEYEPGPGAYDIKGEFKPRPTKKKNREEYFRATTFGGGDRFDGRTSTGCYLDATTSAVPGPGAYRSNINPEDKAPHRPLHTLPHSTLSRSKTYEPLDESWKGATYSRPTLDAMYPDHVFEQKEVAVAREAVKALDVFDKILTAKQERQRRFAALKLDEPLRPPTPPPPPPPPEPIDEQCPPEDAERAKLDGLRAKLDVGFCTRLLAELNRVNPALGPPPALFDLLLTLHLFLPPPPAPATPAAAAPQPGPPPPPPPPPPPARARPAPPAPAAPPPPPSGSGSGAAGAGEPPAAGPPPLPEWGALKALVAPTALPPALAAYDAWGPQPPARRLRLQAQLGSLPREEVERASKAAVALYDWLAAALEVRRRAAQATQQPERAVLEEPAPLESAAPPAPAPPAAPKP